MRLNVLHLKAMLSLIVLCIALSACSPTTNVETSYGTVRGFNNKGVLHFRGIPYAKPPIGELRWQAPQQLQSWWGIYPATMSKPACIQGTRDYVIKRDSEDCLYLNIWAPENAENAPVMVWLHGGAFIMGASNEIQYKGEALARELGIVFVSVNYRLSYLGFLALPTSPDAGQAPILGNQGFLDQIAALQWVKDEISAFGGDSDRITLFGESAGAMSTCILMASSLANGLFNRAILQSGNCEMRPALSLEEATQRGSEVLAKLDCDTAPDPIACAKKWNPRAIMDAIGVEEMELLYKNFADWAFNPLPIVDHNFLTDDPMNLITENSNPDVEVIIGTNADEGSLFSIVRDHPEDDDAYLAYLQNRYLNAEGDSLQMAEEVHNLYSLSEHGTSGNAIAQIATDAGFTCTSRRLANTLANNGHSVYFYHFTQDVGLGAIMQLMAGDNAPDASVIHGSEMPFVLLNPPFGKGMLAYSMSRYWTEFAATGSPNGNNLIEWLPYSEDQLDYIDFGEPMTMRTGLRDRFCDYWDQHTDILSDERMWMY